jgi:CubicO group peptidase (beta-lactamase class C family)
MADRENGRPMQRDTLVRIYSMTKPITGVALMSLYEDGLFALDDPLARYLPEYADIKVYVRGQGDDVHLVAPARPRARRVYRTDGPRSAGDSLLRPDAARGQGYGQSEQEAVDQKRQRV